MLNVTCRAVRKRSIKVLGKIIATILLVSRLAIMIDLTAMIMLTMVMLFALMMAANGYRHDYARLK